MTLIKLLVEGGNMSPGPAVAQTLGPMGINMGQVISDINSATTEFEGITVPVHLEVNSKTKEFSIKVLSPPTSELIKKELGIEKASGERLKQRVGNLAIEQVISISKAKHSSLLSKEFISTVKSVVGTCQSLGVLIESKEASEVQEEIVEGKYSDKISAKKTEVDSEKKEELEEYFKNVELEQEAVRKAEEEEKAAEEEKKASESIEVAPEEKGEEKEEEKEE
jgi:large subunit ribosomal protein L11